jgi:antitoxin VapB
MPLSIEDPEADRLARAVAQRTGESISNAVVTALRERLAREDRKAEDMENLVQEAMAIGRHFTSLSVRDNRQTDEMLYDETGMPA